MPEPGYLPDLGSISTSLGSRPGRNAASAWSLPATHGWRLVQAKAGDLVAFVFAEQYVFLGI